MSSSLFESARVYVPAEYRLALSLQVSLPELPHGAALFADISGFTPLTEALTRALGLRRGAEELPLYLNKVYDALISEVDRFGGSVIGFAGDAITCWFDDAPVGFDGPVPSGAERAAYCALALQAAIQAFAAIPVPGQNPVSLALKVSVAAGTVRRFLVGDPATQTIELIAGSTVMRMAAGEHIAAKGETIFDQPTAQALGERLLAKEQRCEPSEPEPFTVVDGLEGEPATLPWPEPDEARLLVESLRTWVHPPIFESIAEGQGDFLTELRPATALFMRFGGIDFDEDPESGDKMDCLTRWAQGVLNPYEAIITHPTIGDKGSFLCISFGAPTAHDDDPQRAAAAALELIHPPAELAFLTSPQIGISQGTARTGAYGGQTRRTYDILGDQVNLAARLMMAAKPGEILVSRRIQEQVQGDFELTSLAPIAVKGKSQPVAVARLEARKLGGGLQAMTAQALPLVGRETDLERLDAVLKNALRGQGQIVHITGPAGIGKSRLVADFAAKAAKGGLRLLASACQSTSQDVPYRAWQPIFRSLLNLQPGQPDPAAFLETALQDRNRQWGERTPLLGALLGLALPDNPTTAALDARLRYEATQTLAVDLLQSVALEQPLLLVLDDIHWMDEAGKDLMLAVGRITAGMTCTLCLLERSSSEASPELTRLPGYIHLELAPLAPEAVSEIVANCLGGPAAPLIPAVVYAQAQGNPHFAEQLSRVMQETGSLVQGQGRWVFNEAVINALRDANCIQKDLDTDEWVVMPGAAIPTSAVGVPDSVQGVMLARVDRLPDAHKLTLRTASVIGREFDLRLLGLAHPARPSEQALAGQMELLVKGEFFAPGSGEGRYAFTHNALQEVLYNAQPTASQEDLHWRAGAALESLEPEGVALLAYHYARAGAETRPKTLHYLDLAAGQAKAGYANQTALNYYRQALALEERWQWRKGQAEVLHLLGLREEEKAAIAALEQAPGASQVEAARLYFELHIDTAEYAAASEDAERMRALAHEAGDWVGEADGLRQLGWVQRKQGENQAALECYQQAQVLFDGRKELTKAEQTAKTHLLYNWGWLLYRMNEYDKAGTMLKETLEMAHQERLANIEIDTLNALGGNCLPLGNLSQARVYFDAARDRAMAVGDRMNQARSLINLSLVEQRAKDYSQAKVLLEAALHLIQAVGDRWNEINTWNALGVIFQDTGQYLRAEKAFQCALDISREIGDEEGTMYLSINQALIKRDLNDLDGANILLAEGLAIGEKQENAFMVAAFISQQSILNLLKGGHTDAARLAATALDSRTELGVEATASDNLAVLALANTRLGQLAQAGQWADLALQILDTTGGEGLENPIQDYWFCYQVLAGLGQDERSRQVLGNALRLVQRNAERMIEAQMRQSYLENVPACREILGEARRLGMIS